MKGRQDRDGIHEAWLMNRFDHADTPDPITQSLYCCIGEVLSIQHHNCQDLQLENTKSHATE